MYLLNSKKYRKLNKTETFCFTYIPIAQEVKWHTSALITRHFKYTFHITSERKQKRTKTFIFTSLFLKRKLPSKSPQVVTLLTCILNVPSSNLGCDTDYLDNIFVFFLSCSRKMLGDYINPLNANPCHMTTC
jgi:hypothetical protein